MQLPVSVHCNNMDAAQLMAFPKLVSGVTEESRSIPEVLYVCMTASSDRCSFSL